MIELTPFRDRLREILAEKHPGEGAQAWLARASGAERSTISRILQGRVPSRETLDLIAPVLGITVDELVDGTEAAAKTKMGPEFVPNEHYTGAVAKMLEFERRANDAEALARQHARTGAEELERRHRAEDQVASLERDNREIRDDVAKGQSEISHLHHRVRRRTEALEKAVKELNELRARVAELRAIAEDGQKTGRIAAILAAVAAFTGVVTVATYLGRDDDDDEDDKDAEGSAK